MSAMNGSAARGMAVAAAAGEVGPTSRWRSVTLVILGALLAGAAAAWLGYRNHIGAETVSTPVLSAGGAAVPIGQDAQDPANRSAPQAAPRAAGQAGATRLAWPIWEFRLRQPIPPREPSLTPPTWRLIGSSLAGGKWSIIVLRQGNTAPEYFSVGQELPGGYRIEAINDQDVTLTQGKRVMVLSYIGSR